MADRLASLKRLHQHTLSNARLGLARSLDRASAAADGTAVVQASIIHEIQIVRDLPEGDAAITNCDTWLVASRASLVAARSEQLRAGEDVNRLRNTVVAAHAAAEAVEAMLTTQAALRQTEDQRREQYHLDEISQHRNAVAQSNRR